MSMNDEIHGLMSRHNRESEFPVSRDWADVDCQAIGCQYNRNLKCSVPSLAKIGNDGRCTGFTPITFKTKVDGD